MKLVDQLPAPAARVPGRTGLDPDELYTRFVEWTETRGLALYTAQDEAIMELASGANVILASPTGSGKSLVAIGVHFQALARGRRRYDTGPTKALGPDAAYPVGCTAADLPALMRRYYWSEPAAEVLRCTLACHGAW